MSCTVNDKIPSLKRTLHQRKESVHNKGISDSEMTLQPFVFTIYVNVYMFSFVVFMDRVNEYCNTHLFISVV